LEKVDQITESISEVTTNVSSLVAVFSATLGSPLVKLAGLTQGLRSALLGKKK
jgi:ABC-type antimicrobial peptide transport system permease subunit